MKAKILMVLFLIAYSAPGVALGGEMTNLWTPGPLQELINEGFAQNEQLKSLAATVEGTRDEAVFAGSLDDPRVGFGVLNLPTDSFSFDQEPMTQKQVFVAQKVPWFGKRALRRGKVDASASRQEAMLAARQNELARLIAHSWLDLGFIHESLEINEKTGVMVDQLLRVAEVRYASGKGLQQDVLQAQVERSKVVEENITLEEKERKTQDRLHELLNRVSFETILPPGNLESLNMVLDKEELTDKARRNNPRLIAEKIAIDEAKLGVDLAEKSYAPDMDFKFAYGQRDNLADGRDLTDFVSASVVMNIPLWMGSRQDKKVSASKKRRLASESAFNNLYVAIPHRVDALVVQTEKTWENYRFYQDALIHQADQWSSASLSAYEVGKLEFNTVLNARLRLLRFERMAANYLYTAYKNLASLNELIGGYTGLEHLDGKGNES